MIRKLTLALLLTLPSMAMAIDLDGYQKYYLSLESIVTEVQLLVLTFTNY
ncbi:hypothetical protein OAS65_02020 [Methylophilaceae bacterium]|nr:hypothetical protein [Methylophilaceae bacterium]